MITDHRRRRSGGGQLSGQGALDELDRASDIVVACRSGSRSAHAARYLRDHGFTAVAAWLLGTV